MLPQRRTSSRTRKVPRRFQSPEPSTKPPELLSAQKVQVQESQINYDEQPESRASRAKNSKPTADDPPAVGPPNLDEVFSLQSTKATAERPIESSSSPVEPEQVCNNKRPRTKPPPQPRPAIKKTKLSNPPRTIADQTTAVPLVEPDRAQVPPMTTKAKSSKLVSKVDFCFNNDTADPIILNLREVSEKYKHVPNIDSEILDQVALEGLTGITFGRLCLLLDAINPKLNACKDAAAQDYIWSVLVGRYLSRTPGARVQVFHNDLGESIVASQGSGNDDAQQTTENDSEQRKELFIDKQMTLPSQSLQRMARSEWILQPIQDGLVMGSCPNYTSRLNISDDVLKLFQKLGPRKSMLQVHHKYNMDAIYLVADQDIRKRALLPSSCDPNMDIKLREYVCLELIGRTRCFGIVFPNDKILGRYRILLSAKGLITQYQQTCNTYIVHHIKRLSRYILEQSTVEASSSSETKTKAFKLGLVGVKQEPFEGHEEDTNDDLRDAAENFYHNPTVKSTCCDPARLRHGKGILRMVYDVIANSRGRSIDDIRRILRLPKSHVRNHIKNLANLELVGSHTRIVDASMTRIYRTRHRRKRTKVTRDGGTVKTGRGKWDSIDVQAREMLGLRRSQFSQAEDSLLILSHITGLLINPTYSKSFLVTKQVVRDILHDELDESHDKTSDALLRRAKFLRSSAQNLSRINELLADLRDDPDIKRLMAANKGNTVANEKLIKFFKQLLKAIRAKLPHLLGLTATSNSSPSSSAQLPSISLNSEVAVKIASYKELRDKYKLSDCRQGNSSTKAQNQPSSSLVQLIHRTDLSYSFKVEKCDDGMQTIMLLASRCVQTCFNLSLKLKVPVRVVALDEENENYKEIKEKSKDNKETSKLIENLTTPFPTADSRRALFMLRNALRNHNIDKGGKLSDALIVQPCQIIFTAEDDLEFNERHLLEEFLEKSKFFNELIVEDKHTDQEDKKKRKRAQDRRRVAEVKRSCRKVTSPETPDEQPTASTSGVRSCDQLDGGKARKATKSTTSPEADEDEANMADGKTNYECLLKMIEAIMSWVSTQPGIELEMLQTKMGPLLGKRNNGHLNEILELMEALELISRDFVKQTPCRLEPRLFGYTKQFSTNQRRGHHQAKVITLAPRENAFVRLCQLADVDL